MTDINKPSGSTKRLLEFRKREQAEIDRLITLKLQTCVNAAIKTMESTHNFMAKDKMFKSPPECDDYKQYTLDVFNGPYAGSNFKFNANGMFKVEPRLSWGLDD